MNSSMNCKCNFMPTLAPQFGPTQHCSAVPCLRSPTEFVREIHFFSHGFKKLATYVVDNFSKSQIGNGDKNQEAEREDIFVSAFCLKESCLRQEFMHHRVTLKQLYKMVTYFLQKFKNSNSLKYWSINLLERNSFNPQLIQFLFYCSIVRT